MRRVAGPVAVAARRRGIAYSQQGGHLARLGAAHSSNVWIGAAEADDRPWKAVATVRPEEAAACITTWVPRHVAL